MDEYVVDILPGEILRWVHEDAAAPPHRLWARASRRYGVESEGENERAGIGEDDEVAAVSVRGVLEVSPQGGRGGWTLQVRAEDPVGLQASVDEEGYDDDDDLTVDAFEAQFLVPEHGDIEVVVLAEDADAWERFQRWLQAQRPPPRGRRARA